MTVTVNFKLAIKFSLFWKIISSQKLKPPDPAILKVDTLLK